MTYTIRNQEAKPIDRVAARVVRGGESDERTTNPECFMWDQRPLTRPFPGPRSEDLTGMSTPRAVVVGYLGYIGNERRKDGGLWLFRCACGTYQAIRSRTLRKSLEASTVWCAKCDRVNSYRNCSHEKSSKLGVYTNE